MRFVGSIDSRSVEQREFDVLIAACGYESRARYLPSLYERRARNRIAIEFSEQRVLAFESNRDQFRSADYRLLDDTDGLRDWIVGIGRQQGPVTCFVDVSSQSRARLAAIVVALQDVGRAAPVSAIFGYSIARYAKLVSHPSPNVHIGPVSSEFAGWSSEPGRAVSLVAGLGYEQDRALGAVEYLEPTATWLLVPHSSIRRYERAVKSANSLLLESVRPENVIDYRVEEPNESYAKLASLSLHLGRNGQVVLLPGGPKILALLSLLLGIEMPNVAVWRVTAGGGEVPVDRQASEHAVFVQVEFDGD